MRHKALKTRRKPLNLTVALITFGKLRRTHPDCLEEARLGQRLVRELQHLHDVLEEVRNTLPQTYLGYVDPARVDTALARTAVYDLGEQDVAYGERNDNDRNPERFRL